MAHAKVARASMLNAMLSLFMLAPVTFKTRSKNERLGRDTNAFLNLDDVSNTLGGVLKVILVLLILGATIGLLMTSIADIVNAITTTTTNNTTADLLRPVFGLIVAVTGLFLIVRKVIEAAR